MPVMEETTEVEVVEEKPEQTPIPEESVETLKSQLTKMTDELAQAKKGLSTAHQTISQRDAELKRKADIESDIVGIREEMQLLASAIVTKQEDSDTPRPDILASLRARQAEQDVKRKTAEATAQLEGYRKRVEAAGLTEADEEYWSIYDEARTLDPVKLKKVDIRLAKLEKEKQKVATPQTDEDKKKEFDLLIEEGVRKEMERRGLLKDEISNPAKGKGTPQEAMLQYAQGKISAEEAKKRGASFD